MLNVQLPTGYGKTLAATATYATLRSEGHVNRLLYLVSTDAQRRQFIKDGGQDLADAGLPGLSVFDIGYSPTRATKEHRQDRSSVFVTTIQSLATGQLLATVKDMMATGRWMVVVDEHHHYALGESRWGNVVRGLNAQFLLAASATPHRRDDNGAFGAPSVSVTYLEAYRERAVKQLVLHAYEYRVDAISVNGQVYSFTTSDVVNEVGSADPAEIDKFLVNRRLRWSPKYISPLVSIPVERLLTRRCDTGLPLQMIVGAMGCQHAEMVCEQIRAMFGDMLRVDWVGTGPSGRSDEENRALVEAFCPPKRANGKRHPGDIKLDVLVHVGMAGEGLDAVYVTEVVHINPANITNQNNQENGRAARRIPNVDGLPPVEDRHQVAYINVDSSSPYAEWSGTRVMSLFDASPDAVPPADEPEPSGDPVEYHELPDEPRVFIANCELLHIDKGDPEVRQWAEHVGAATGVDGLAILSDSEHPDHDRLFALVQSLRRDELQRRAAGMDRMSVLAQLRNDLNIAVGKVAYLAVRTSVAGRFEKSAIGDMKRRLSSAMVRFFDGSVDDADEDGLRKRYAWVKTVERQLRANEVPVWLA